MSPQRRRDRVVAVTATLFLPLGCCILGNTTLYVGHCKIKRDILIFIPVSSKLFLLFCAQSIPVVLQVDSLLWPGGRLKHALY